MLKDVGKESMTYGCMTFENMVGIQNAMPESVVSYLALSETTKIFENEVK